MVNTKTNLKLIPPGFHREKCRNEIICYMGNFSVKPFIRFVVVSCGLFGLPITN